MADEDLEEVVVNSTAKVAPSKRPPSAWKVGLLGSLAAGPLVGIPLGIVQSFKNKNFYQRETERQARDKAERAQLSEFIAGERKIADPAEQRVIDYANGLVADGYERLAGGDKSGNEVLAKARALLEGVLGKDVDQLKQEEQAQRGAQRELIGASAKGYRTEFQDTQNMLNGIHHQSDRILSLVADPKFDPNKPLNKSLLAELSSASALMFKDTPDLLDGLAQGVGAFNGVAGGIASGIATMVKSDDFKLRPEDYNRIALNAKKYSKIYADQKSGQLGDQARSLDAIAKKLGLIPEDYSLGDYISGAEKEMRYQPDPVFTGGFEEKQEAQRGRGRPAPTTKLLGGGNAPPANYVPVIRTRPTN